MSPKWSTRFELKPNRWVFVPTEESVALGNKIKKHLAAHWRCPSYYFHLRSGGHLAALELHLEHEHFFRVDIEDFFGSINRTRVTRCLKDIVAYDVARNWANASTVRHPNEDRRTLLPYGFVQSPMIASICLRLSALGRALQLISKKDGVAVSVYVDDIIISTNNAGLCNELLGQVTHAAELSRFALAKQQGPAASITAFNIDLSPKSLEVGSARLQEFITVLANDKTLPAQRDGILRYVATVNPKQAAALAGLAS
jgi:hypothetical protein